MEISDNRVTEKSPGALKSQELLQVTSLAGMTECGRAAHRSCEMTPHKSLVSTAQTTGIKADTSTLTQEGKGA